MANFAQEAFLAVNQTADESLDVVAPLVEKEEERTMMSVPNNKKVFFEIAQNAWNTFHKYFVYILIAMAIGVYIGVTAAKANFTSKMDDATKVGGMVLNGKIYSISPK